MSPDPSDRGRLRTSGAWPAPQRDRVSIEKALVSPPPWRVRGIDPVVCRPVTEFAVGRGGDACKNRCDEHRSASKTGNVAPLSATLCPPARTRSGTERSSRIRGCRRSNAGAGERDPCGASLSRRCGRSRCQCAPRRTRALAIQHSIRNRDATRKKLSSAEARVAASLP